MKHESNVTLNAGEKIGLISNLSTMLAAGLPIFEVVLSLSEDAKGNQKKILDALLEDLTQGKRVHTSFARFPRVFDKVTVSVVNASEEAGTLVTTLKDLRENIRKQMEFNDKVKSALLYPIFIFGVFFAVLGFILVFVIPKVADVFIHLKIKLPLPTRILIFLSKTLTGNPIALVVIIAVIGGLVFLIMRYKRNWVTGILFSLPLISHIVKLIDFTRFTRSMHLLLYSGLPITEALELTQDMCVKRQSSKVIKACSEMVLSGKKLSQGLRQSKGYVPGIMVKLIEAGEKTGTLDQSMQDISEYFDYEVSQALKTFLTLLEPIMLVVIGVVVGGMMLSVIAPIYGLISQVGGK